MTQATADGSASSDWIRVEGLTKRYGAVPALADVAFSIRPGEILGLVAGRIGLWAKTDSTSYFKDYTVSSK